MRSLSLLLAAITLFPKIVQSQDPTPVYLDPKAPLEARVEDLTKRLEPDEKLALLSGTGFTTKPIARLKLPGLGMADAGEGVRGGMWEMTGPATAFPAGVCTAATWNVELGRRVGQAIGEECRNKGGGAMMLLGPAVNIHRTPQGGRNAEYMSEDPFLTARMAVGYIQGMQSTGVAACIKHFACNNHEFDRFNMNVSVGERALREIYFPAFEAGVKEGKVWTVMSSYNKLNGTYATANRYLLTDVLKKGWGFDGMVVSDWGAVHETPVVQAGNDVEMPDDKHMNVGKLKEAMAAGTVTQEAVDEAVRRIARTILRTGTVDGQPAHPSAGNVNSTEHNQVALEDAAEGIVLLKNERSLLPLEKGKIRTLAVIGETAHALELSPRGSPHVPPLRRTEIIDVVRQLAGLGVAVKYATGRRVGEPLTGPAVSAANPATHAFKAEYFKNEKLEGEPALVRMEDEINLFDEVSPAPGLKPEHFSVRWTAKLTAPATGDYVLSFKGDDGYRVMLDGKTILDQWSAHREALTSATVALEAGRAYDLRVEFYQEGGEVAAQLSWKPAGQPDYAAATDAARGADAVVLCLSTLGQEGEGHDRPSLDLPDRQTELLRAVLAVNKNVAVVLNNGTPVMMADWIADVPAVLEAWLPGQAGGAAVAGILFGQINPSGKLPDTLAAKRGDYPDAPNFPGKDSAIRYDEGIYVGYRHFDKRDIAPLFPFGHGLSYTSFAYKNLKVSAPSLPTGGEVTASVEITNTGQREGKETAQLYVHDTQPKIDRPVRELKGFAKVALQPGETKTVEFKLKGRDFAYFDVAGKQWKADAGEYEVQVGASSRDIREKATVRLDTAWTEAVPGSREGLVE